MSNKLSKALDTCIVRIGRGESIEQCLSDYPEIEGELGQLLHIFTLISKSPKVVPSDSFRRQSKAQVMAHIRQSEKHEQKQTHQYWLVRQYRCQQNVLEANANLQDRMQGKQPFLKRSVF